jgi:hypothetical protein
MKLKVIFCFLMVQGGLQAILFMGSTDFQSPVGLLLFRLSREFQKSDHIRRMDPFIDLGKRNYNKLFYAEQDVFKRLNVRTPTFEEYFDSLQDVSLKIAWSDMGGGVVPESFVNDLNNHFDAVVVPEKVFIEVYEKSGVTIPIFYIPLGLWQDLNQFQSKHDLALEKKKFVFTIIAKNFFHNNLVETVKAFDLAFKHNSRVFLHLYCQNYFDFNDSLKSLLQVLDNDSIVLQDSFISANQYLKFITESDCIVDCSLGNQVSIIAKESIKRGVPCILSDTLFHKGDLESGVPLACGVGEKKFLYSSIEGILHENLDTMLCVPVVSCSGKSIINAFTEMYENYSFYLKKTQQASLWANQFEWKNILPFYQTLLDPKIITLGLEDSLNALKKEVVTKNKKFHDKYMKLKNKQKECI